MTATQDLIAAALTATDDLDRICMLAQINPCTSSVDLREMCARAMVQTNPKTCSDERPCTPCFTDNGPCEGPSAQPVSAASDADMQVYQAIADGYARDTQPVGEVPMPDRTLYGPDRTVLGHIYTAAKVRTYGEQCRAAGYAAGGKDAERYRFLRGDGGPASVRWPRWEVTHWTGNWNPVSGKELDAAIDAALRGEVK